MLNLAIKLTPDSLTAITWKSGEAGSLSDIELKLQSDVGATPGDRAFFDPEFPLGSLEEAVYATPLLTADYASVTVVVDTTRFLVIPHDLSDELARRITGAEEVDTLVRTRIESTDADVAMVLPTELVSFINRAFRNPRIVSPIALEASYRARNVGQSSASLYATLFDTHVDIVGFGGDDNRFEFANRFAISQTTSDDMTQAAAYYIATALRQNNDMFVEDINDDDDHHVAAGTEVKGNPDVIIAGLRQPKTDVVALLRMAGIKAVPALFPPEIYRYNPQRSVVLPFDLMLTLCE